MTMVKKASIQKLEEFKLKFFLRMKFVRMIVY